MILETSYRHEMDIATAGYVTTRRGFVSDCAAVTKTTTGTPNSHNGHILDAIPIRYLSSVYFLPAATTSP